MFKNDIFKKLFCLVIIKGARMANMGLVIFGIIVLILTFFITQVMITPQQKQQVELAKQACNFNVFGIPVGQIGQALSPDIASKCEQVQTASLIMTWGWVGYVIGFILLVGGLATGGKKEVVREIIRESVKAHKEDVEETPKISKGKGKFCGNCGEKISSGDKFCPSCGEKV